MYKWKAGSVHAVEAEVAGKALESIVERHGAITPGLLVRESRPEDAPLHDEFEWDDSVAAECYREQQASYVIRSITVTVDVPEREDIYVRAFVSVVPLDGSGAESSDGDESRRVYLRTVDALADPGYRRQVLEQALKEAEAWQRKYAELQEFAQVFDAVQSVRQRLLQPAG